MHVIFGQTQGLSLRTINMVGTDYVSVRIYNHAHVHIIQYLSV